jgi:hypothetical protein
MSARVVEWGDEPFALLVEPDDGSRGYLVGPIVLDLTGRPIEGIEVLAAIAASGVSAAIPLIRDAAPSDLAEIDRRLARISETLGVPIGPPT